MEDKENETGVGEWTFFFPDSVEPDNAPRDFGPGMALTLEQRGFQIPVH